MPTPPPASHGRGRLTDGIEGGVAPEVRAPSLRLVLARQLQFGSLLLLSLTLVIAQFAPNEQAFNYVPELFVLATILGLLWVILDPMRGGISLMVGFYFTLFLSVPAMLQVNARSYPFGGTYSTSVVLAGYSLLTLSLIAFILGVAVGNARARGRASQAPRAPQNAAPFRRAAMYCTFLCTGIAAFVGPEILFASRSEISGVRSSSEGMREQLLLVGRSLSLLSAVISVHLLARDRASRLRGDFLVVAVWSMAIFIILNFPLALPRFQLLGCAIAIACVILNMFSTRVKALAALIAPGFLIFLFPVIKRLTLGETLREDIWRKDALGYMLGVDFDSFKQTLDTWRFTQLGWDRDGENFLGAVLFWVPRDVWADKPRHTGELVAESLGYGFMNVSSPLTAELYVSFSVLGVALGFMTLGWIVNRVESSVAASRNDTWTKQILLYALLSGFITILLRGALNAVAPMIGPGILVALVLVYTTKTNADVSYSNRLS